MSVMIFLSVFALYYGLLKLYYFMPSRQLRTNAFLLTKPLIFVVLVLILVLFAVLRKVSFPGIGGTDAITYVVDFQNATRRLSYYLRWELVQQLRSREPIYLFVMWLFRQITENYKLYFLFLYGIIAVCFTYAITRSILSSRFMLPALLILVAYLHAFNVMRNWVAIAFLMVAMIQFEKKRHNVGIIFAVLAVGFHYSTAIFFAAYAGCHFISNLKWNRKRLTILWAGMSAGIIASATVIRLLMQGTKYAYYSNLASSYLGYLPIVLITIMAIFYYPQLIKGNHENELYVLMSMVNSAMIYVYVNIGGYRINDTFVLVRVILLSKMMQIVDIRYAGITKFILKMLLSSFIVVYFFQQFLQILETSGVIPYLIG